MKDVFTASGVISLVFLSLSLMLSGCASARHVDASSMDQLRNITYQGIYAQPVTLKNGRYEGQPFTTGGSSRPQVQLIEQLMVSGDMTGDGNAEAAVFLTESSGGSGVYTYLAIVTKDGFSYRNIATSKLGDRIQVRSLRLVEGTLILEFITSGPGDA